jgi:hypothetical protein
MSHGVQKTGDFERLIGRMCKEVVTAYSEVQSRIFRAGATLNLKQDYYNSIFTFQGSKRLHTERFKDAPVTS